MLSTEMGYAYAQSIDVVLNRALKNHPVSHLENYKGYLALIRTVKTSLSILETKNSENLPKCPECGKPDVGEIQ